MSCDSDLRRVPFPPPPPPPPGCSTLRSTLQQNAEAVGVFCQSSVTDGEPDPSLRAVLSRMKAVAVNNAPISSDIHPMSYKPSADNVIWEATTAAAQNCEQVS